jgi:hypothetical protein
MTDRRERDRGAYPGLDGVTLLREADSGLMFPQSVGHAPSRSGGEPGHPTLHQSGAEGLEGPVESGGREDSSRSQEMGDHRAAASGRERRDPSISQIMRNRSQGDETNWAKISEVHSRRRTAATEGKGRGQRDGHQPTVALVKNPSTTAGQLAQKAGVLPSPGDPWVSPENPRPLPDRGWTHLLEILGQATGLIGWPRSKHFPPLTMLPRNPDNTASGHAQLRGKRGGHDGEDHMTVWVEG